MSGEALEQALALLRTPLLRQSFSARPLPDDTAQLVQMASGSSVLVAEAAQRTGETESTVLEAARFYLQEVMFFQGADAYRVLGVARDADDQRIKSNYRLLQRWLHPDRDDGDGMSVHAARVNQAWAELRSPERRSAYDARLSQEQSSIPAIVPIAPTRPRVVLPDWHADQDAEPGVNLRRGLPLAALMGVGGCLLLGILVVRQLQLEPPAWEPSQEKPGSAKVADSDEAGDAGRSPASFVTTPADALAEPPAPMQVLKASSPPVPAQARVAREVRVAVPVAMTPRSAKAASPPEAMANVKQPSPIDVADTARERLPSVKEAVRTSATKTRVATIPPAPVRAPARVPGNQHADSNAIARKTRSRSPSVAVPEIPEANLAQVVAAQQRAQQIVVYLTAANSRPPPVWNDLRTQQQVERMRQDLHGRNDTLGSRGQSFSLAEPQWRIRADAATLDSGYRFAGTHDSTETGRLRMTMVWRQGRWLVSRVLLDPGVQ